MQALYEIRNEYIEALNNVTVNEDGEVDMSNIENIEAEFDEKTEQVCLYIKNQEAMATAIREEEKALAERRKSLESKNEWLKRYLEENMSAVGKVRFETAKCKVSFRKSESVEIIDELDVPGDYMKCKYEVNKTDVKAAIKAGIDVPGCVLVTRQNIQIK